MYWKSPLGMVAATALVACASAPLTSPILEDARLAVRAAEADPNVAKYDPLDLQSAQQDLATAETSATQHRAPEVSQFAYLAGQTARTAQARAASKADDARVAAGQAQRDQIRLAARERDVQSAQAAKQAADAKAAQLQSEVEKLKAAQTSRGLVLTLGDVLFATGKAQLNPGAARNLDQLAQFLAQHTDRRVKIDGFTDSVGSDSFNEQLSENRAAAVKTALIGLGVEPSRITIQGFGKEFPVASNGDAGGRQLNRRVEVVIGGEDNSAIAPRS